MSIARERLIALAALVFSVLVMATSVEIGRNAIESALSGVTAYGTVAVFGALALSVGLRKIWKASKTVLAVAVVIALVLFGMGKALAEVVS
ncbi:hypothetical protein ACGF7W_39380 [Streptomyces sp. NPDC048219]|uniref:hypothetical protein n=1 Tax=Streptomyces sp. NPDC048219 TaxID=3365517 RepID=UPI003721B2F7